MNYKEMWIELDKTLTQWYKEMEPWDDACAGMLVAYGDILELMGRIAEGERDITYVD